MVSFAYQDQVALAFEVAQSVMLDNSAFTVWGIWRARAMGVPGKPQTAGVPEIDAWNLAHP